MINNGGCSLSNYSWTIPAGWDQIYTSGNMISVYTNSFPGGRVEVDSSEAINAFTLNFCKLSIHGVAPKSPREWMWKNSF